MLEGLFLGLFWGLVFAALLALIELVRVLLALYRGWKAGGDYSEAKARGKSFLFRKSRSRADIYKPGDRIQLHPSVGGWSKDYFGTVESVDSSWCYVRFDGKKRLEKLRPYNLVGIKLTDQEHRPGKTIAS